MPKISDALTQLKEKLPNRPPAHFSDPWFEFEGAENFLNDILQKPFHKLAPCELRYLMNEDKPAGNFQEMAPYVLHILARLEKGNAYDADLFQSVLLWFQRETKELRQCGALKEVQNYLRSLFLLLIQSDQEYTNPAGKTILRHAPLLDLFFEPAFATRDTFKLIDETELIDHLFYQSESRASPTWQNYLIHESRNQDYVCSFLPTEILEAHGKIECCFH